MALKQARNLTYIWIVLLCTTVTSDLNLCKEIQEYLPTENQKRLQK